MLPVSTDGSSIINTLESWKGPLRWPNLLLRHRQVPHQGLRINGNVEGGQQFCSPPVHLAPVHQPHAGAGISSTKMFSATDRSAKGPALGRCPDARFFIRATHLHLVPLIESYLHPGLRPGHDLNQRGLPGPVRPPGSAPHQATRRSPHPSMPDARKLLADAFIWRTGSLCTTHPFRLSPLYPLQLLGRLVPAEDEGA